MIRAGEIFESEKPVLVNEKQLVADSGGIGKYRSGTGQRFSMTSSANQPMTFAMRGESLKHPAQGLFGGGHGAAGVATVNGQPIHSKRTILLNPGDALVLQAPGGGGYGNGAERDAAARADDLRNEYVSR